MSSSRRVRNRALAVALCVLLAAGCGTASDGSPVEEPRPADTAPVLVMTAMPIELAPLLEATQVDERIVVNGRTHHVGVLEEMPVVLVAAGISMVNATMGAQAAVGRFAPRAIVFSGIAGGASPEIRIGDVTVPARWSQYQEHVFTDATRTGWRRGWRNEDLGAFGFMYPQRVWATTPAGTPDDEHLKLWFDADADLLDLARAAAADVELSRCNEAGDCLDHAPTVRIGGNGVSGPTFVDDAAYRDWVWDTFAPDGFDMETAAVGHVAYANGIPYVGVRSISDMAGATPGENRVESFAPIAARNAATVVRAMLRVSAPDDR